MHNDATRYWIVCDELTSDIFGSYKNGKSAWRFNQSNGYIVTMKEPGVTFSLDGFGPDSVKSYSHRGYGSYDLIDSLEGQFHFNMIPLYKIIESNKDSLQAVEEEDTVIWYSYINEYSIQEETSTKENYTCFESSDTIHFDAYSTNSNDTIFINVENERLVLIPKG